MMEQVEIDEILFCLNLAFETMQTKVSEETKKSVLKKISKVLDRENEIE